MVTRLCSHLSTAWKDLSRKIVGHRQFCDLGMQIANRIVVNLGGCRFSATLKGARAP